MQSQHKDAIDTQLCVSDGKMLNLLDSEYESSGKRKKKVLSHFGIKGGVNVDFRQWLN